MKAVFKSSIKNDDIALQKHLAVTNKKHKPLKHNIELSLDEYTDLDELDEDNKFICKPCTVKVQQKSKYVCT